MGTYILCLFQELWHATTGCKQSSLQREAWMLGNSSALCLLPSTPQGREDILLLKKKKTHIHIFPVLKFSMDWWVEEEYFQPLPISSLTIPYEKWLVWLVFQRRHSDWAGLVPSGFSWLARWLSHFVFHNVVTLAGTFLQGEVQPLGKMGCRIVSNLFGYRSKARDTNQ